MFSDMTFFVVKNQISQSNKMNLKLDKSVEVKSRKFSPYFRLKTKVRLIYCCAFTWT